MILTESGLGFTKACADRGSDQPSLIFGIQAVGMPGMPRLMDSRKNGLNRLKLTVFCGKTDVSRTDRRCQRMFRLRHFTPIGSKTQIVCDLPHDLPLLCHREGLMQKIFPDRLRRHDVFQKRNNVLPDGIEKAVIAPAVKARLIHVKHPVIKAARAAHHICHRFIAIDHRLQERGKTGKICCGLIFQPHAFGKVQLLIKIRLFPGRDAPLPLHHLTRQLQFPDIVTIRQVLRLLTHAADQFIYFIVSSQFLVSFHKHRPALCTVGCPLGRRLIICIHAHQVQGHTVSIHLGPPMLIRDQRTVPWVPDRR